MHYIKSTTVQNSYRYNAIVLKLNYIEDENITQNTKIQPEITLWPLHQVRS